MECCGCKKNSIHLWASIKVLAVKTYCKIYVPRWHRFVISHAIHKSLLIRFLLFWPKSESKETLIKYLETLSQIYLTSTIRGKYYFVWILPYQIDEITPDKCINKAF